MEIPKDFGDAEATSPWDGV